MSTPINGGKIWTPPENTATTKNRNEKLELALFTLTYLTISGTGASILLLIALGISNLTQK